MENYKRLTEVQINTRAIQHNIRRYRDFLAAHDKTPEIWAVLKANAYGHGIKGVAAALLADVEGFCVGNLQEALAIREVSVGKPLLILAPIQPENWPIAAAADSIVTVPSLEWLQIALNTVSADRIQGAKIHVKVDTGMGRLGAETTDEVNAIIALAGKTGLVVDGVFTHFATAEDEDNKKLSAQLTAFDKLVSQLTERPRYLHTSNSAAGLWHLETIRDIERVGTLIYGLDPREGYFELPFALEAALSLTSELTQVKTVPAGGTVGYADVFIAKEKSIVGTVPVGYSDGWTRDTLGFHVLIEGQKCPIIAMYMNMLSVKLDKPYPIGTRVTLLGENGGDKITAEEIAAHRDMMNTEVVTLIAEYIPRRLVK